MSFVWHHTKRISRAAGKHTLRYFFPPLWHYLTDEYKGRVHHLVVDSMLAVTMMSVLAVNVALGAWLYVFFIPPELEISVSLAAEPAVSGAQLPITIRYQVGKKAVSQVELAVHGPQGWELPEADAQQQLGGLAGGAAGTIELRAPFVTNVDQSNRIIVSYRYRYFGQQYYGLAIAEFTTTQSSLEIVPHVPKKLLNNEETELKFEYVNSSDQPRGRTCLQIDLPDNFTVTGTSHELIDERVCFEKLKPREEGIILIKGTFRNAIGEGQQLINFTAWDYINNTAYSQVVLTNPVHVLTPRLQISTQGSETVNVGDAPRYTLTLTNTGDVNLTNVVATANLNGFGSRVIAITPIDGTQVDNQLRWKISQLAPGTTVTRTFIAQTNSAWREKNVVLNYTARATADIDDIGISTYTTRVAKEIKYNSTLDFSVLQRYTSPTGEQLGYGPYPMAAESITALRVFWDIKDFTNDLSNVTIQTTLPSQVQWTGLTSVTEGSQITYDPASRTVTWHTARVPSFSHAQGAQFEVRVSPNFQQVGQRINVTNNTVFTARDSHTGAVLRRDRGALRTDQPIQTEP